MTSDTTAIPGPWVAESGVTHFETDNGLAVIAVLPELEKTPGSTPTRGMVAWVHAGLGACETDDQAVATARLIAAAPDLLGALELVWDTYGMDPSIDSAIWQTVRATIAKAKGVQNV